MSKSCKPCQQKMINAAKQVMTSNLVNMDIQQQRLEICRVCPSLKRFHKGLPENADIGLLDTCADCGCFLRAKTKLDKASCPLGKWHETV